MSEKENKAVITAFVEEVYNKKNVGAIDKYFAVDYVEHNLGAPDQTGDLDGARRAIADFLAAFPDYHATFDDVFAEGDRVAIRFTCRGTHRGAFGGAGPTGKAVVFGGLAINRLAKGRTAEIWEIIDFPGLAKQIGSTS